MEIEKNPFLNTLNEKHNHTFLYLTILLAFILRIIPVLLTRDMAIGLDDMFQYDMLARSIVSGNGYRWYAQDDLDLVEKYFNIELLIDEYDPKGVPTSFRAPLYPAFLALIYSIFGIGSTRFFYVRLFQTILGTLLVPFTYLIARLFYPEKVKVPRIAAFIVAVYPMLVVYPLALATENLFFILVLLALYFLIKCSERRKWYHFLLSGLCLGLASLTRSVILLFAVLAVLRAFFYLKERKKASIMLVGILLMIMPWMVRNSILHGRLMGIESSLGYNLYMGYHPKSTGTFQYGISMDLIPILDDGIRDEIGQSKANEFIKADPSRFPYLLLRRLGYFFGLEKRVLIYFYVNNFFGYISRGVLLFLLILLLSPFILISMTSVLGFSGIRWKDKNAILLILIIGYLLPHVLILGESRFHLMLVPIMAIGSAVFMAEGFSVLKDRISSVINFPRLSLASVIVVMLILNWILEIIRDKYLFLAVFSLGGNTLYLPY